MSATIPQQNDSQKSGTDGSRHVLRWFARNRGWMVLGISCWFLLTFFHQRHYSSATPVSRLDLIMAICTEGRLEIDSFHKNTPDKALINGHYYSDKAPGTVALALIGSAPAIWIGQALGWTVEDRKLWLAASWAGCAVLAVVLSAGFVCLVQLLSSFAGSRTALATSIFIVFGGMAWPYATLMFSHAQSIGCIAIGMWFLFRSFPERFHIPPGNDAQSNTSAARRYPLFLAGFALGWSLNSEYTTGMIVVGLVVIVIGLDWRSWSWLALGLAGPSLLIPLYSWATIGIPWQLPYSYQASFPEMKKGLYAIKGPNATVGWNLLFSPERGLLFWCPFLGVALLGYASIIRKNARLFLITYFLPILQIAVISGRAWDWPAGPSFSARYLAPILPLLAIPCAFGFKKLPWVAVLIGLVSLALTGIATATNATPSFNAHQNPLITLNLPLLLGLDFNYNLLTQLFRVHAAAGVLVFASLSLLLLSVCFLTLAKPTGLGSRSSLERLCGQLHKKLKYGRNDR